MTTYVRTFVEYRTKHRLSVARFSVFDLTLLGKKKTRGVIKPIIP